jgi:hypothetical protein
MKNFNNKKFNCVCNLCGKQGHKAEECWSNPANANKRPSWWRKKQEVANAGVDEEPKLEYSMMGIDCCTAEDSNDSNGIEVATSINQVVDIWNVPYVFLTHLRLTTIYMDDCFEDAEPEWLQAEVAQEEIALIHENGIFPDDMKLLNDKNVWIIDTGASLSSTGNSEGMRNLINAGNSHTTLGNGGKVADAGIGEIPVTIYDKYGVKQIDACLCQVQLLPGSPFNLLSGTWLIKNGYQLAGNKDAMIFTKGNFKLVCDIKIHTDKGLLYAVYLKRHEVEVDKEVSFAAMSNIKSYTITEAHKSFGHCDEETSRVIAKQLGWHSTKGTMLPCESCARGKAKQKIVAMKELETVKATKPNERIFAGMSSVKEVDGCKGTYQNMWLMVNSERINVENNLL